MSVTRHGPGPRMSAAVVHGNTVYLAGQVSGDSDTMKGQTEQVLKKIDGLLASAGTSKSKLLSATIRLRSPTRSSWSRSRSLRPSERSA